MAEKALNLIETHIKECAQNYVTLKGAVDELTPIAKDIKAIKRVAIMLGGFVAMMLPLFEVWRAFHH